MACIDLAGQQFGRWTALARAHKAGYKDAYWLCRCECGEERVVAGASLRRGLSRSCGCLSREVSSERQRRLGSAQGKIGGLWTKHGQTNSRTYRSWSQMRSRCRNSNHHAWESYGGRGITVCERWDDFANFLADMGERPPDKTLDRIDPDGDYEPNNCRWATWVQQNNNQRRHKVAA